MKFVDRENDKYKVDKAIHTHARVRPINVTSCPDDV